MDTLQQNGVMTYKALTKEYISNQSQEHLQELDKVLQSHIEKSEFTIVLKQMSKGMVSAVERVFDGTWPIPLLGYAPNLTGWKTEAHQIIDQSSIVYENISAKIMESGALTDSIWLTSRLVSSAVACDVLNKSTPQERLALNIQRLQGQTQ